MLNHLFSCPTHSTVLVPGFMWAEPHQVAQFLEGLLQFVDLYPQSQSILTMYFPSKPSLPLDLLLLISAPGGTISFSCFLLFAPISFHLLVVWRLTPLLHNNTRLIPRKKSAASVLSAFNCKIIDRGCWSHNQKI